RDPASLLEQRLEGVLAGLSQDPGGGHGCVSPVAGAPEPLPNLRCERSNPIPPFRRAVRDAEGRAIGCRQAAAVPLDRSSDHDMSTPSPAGLTIERIEDPARFTALREEWDELLASSAADCIFLTWEWLHTWWNHLAAGRRLYLI